jgi:hypothetical protein
VDRHAFDQAQPFRIVGGQEVQPADPQFELGQIDRGQCPAELCQHRRGDLDAREPLDIGGQPLQELQARIARRRHGPGTAQAGRRVRLFVQRPAVGRHRLLQFAQQLLHLARSPCDRMCFL